MLNQHEVGAHNLKVALKTADKLIDILDPAIQLAARERREKQAAKRILPTCNPDARAPRKIYMGGKSVPARSHAVRSAMPRVVSERIAPRNGLVVSSARLPQVAIDMNKVKAYLAK